MSGRAWKFGDGVDTDVLAPGQYMKFSIDEIARHCLESVRPEFAAGVKPGDVLVAGRNFGIGSSREQAPQALKHLGLAVVIVESVAGLYYRNSLNLGLAVLVCKDAATIDDGDLVAADPERGRIRVTHATGGKAGQTTELQCDPVPGFLMDMVRDGGLLPHLEKKMRARV